MSLYLVMFVISLVHMPLVTSVATLPGIGSSLEILRKTTTHQQSNTLPAFMFALLTTRFGQFFHSCDAIDLILTLPRSPWLHLFFFKLGHKHGLFHLIIVLVLVLSGLDLLFCMLPQGMSLEEVEAFTSTVGQKQ